MDMGEATLVMEKEVSQLTDMEGACLHMVMVEVIQCMGMVKVIRCMVKIMEKDTGTVVSTDRVIGHIIFTTRCIT